MRHIKNITINLFTIASVALAFYLFSIANIFLFSSTAFSTGVNWVYLPGGVILVCVLLFGTSGAIGIAIASAVVSHRYYFTDDFVTACGAGFISGFAVWSARSFCMSRLNLDANLRSITVRSLLDIALIFSLCSAVMHQVWFALRGHTDNLFSGTAVMAIGNFTGTIIVLYFVKAVIELVVRLKP
jgi:hypothetical protein